jgi:hypothetical protein
MILGAMSGKTSGVNTPYTSVNDRLKVDQFGVGAMIVVPGRRNGFERRQPCAIKLFKNICNHEN